MGMEWKQKHFYNLKCFYRTKLGYFTYGSLLMDLATKWCHSFKNVKISKKHTSYYIGDRS